MIFAKSGPSVTTIIIIILVIVFVVTVLTLLIKHSNKDPKAIGKRGEETVLGMLNDIQAQDGGHIINDVIVPNGRGTSQIDHIYFSKRGIFIIETKNYSGRIYGNENSTYWTQVMKYGKTKNKLYNPLKQNETHVNAIRKTIGSSVDLTSMIIFVQGNVEYIKCSKVFSLREAKRYIKNFPERYDETELRFWYSKVKTFKDNPVISEEEHIQSIKQRH